MTEEWSYSAFNAVTCMPHIKFLNMNTFVRDNDAETSLAVGSLLSKCPNLLYCGIPSRMADVCFRVLPRGICGLRISLSDPLDIEVTNLVLNIKPLILKCPKLWEIIVKLNLHQDVMFVITAPTPSSSLSSGAVLLFTSTNTS